MTPTASQQSPSVPPVNGNRDHRPVIPYELLNGIQQVDEYVNFYRAQDDEAVSDRLKHYAALARFHHTIANGFYELAWGRSFHFAPFRKGEAFAAALRRHEHYISERLGLTREMTVLDAGCGVGGPMREIARYSGARIVGINIVAEQVETARRYNEEVQLAKQCEVRLADFMHLPMDDQSFDRIYAIGSTCHAPDRVPVFKEFFRVLKPGGLCVLDECCMTDSYDPNNAEHRRIKENFELGYGLPEMITAEKVCQSMRTAGFELLETKDRAMDSDPSRPWYWPLTGTGSSLRGLARSPVARFVIPRALGMAERLGIVPRETRKVSEVLNVGADATVEGGRTGILSALYFVLARKPMV